MKRQPKLTRLASLYWWYFDSNKFGRRTFFNLQSLPSTFEAQSIKPNLRLLSFHVRFDAFAMKEYEIISRCRKPVRSDAHRKLTFKMHAQTRSTHAYITENGNGNAIEKKNRRKVRGTLSDWWLLNKRERAREREREREREGRKFKRATYVVWIFRW